VNTSSKDKDPQKSPFTPDDERKQSVLMRRKNDGDRASSDSETQHGLSMKYQKEKRRGRREKLRRPNWVRELRVNKEGNVVDTGKRKGGQAIADLRNNR